MSDMLKTLFAREAARPRIHALLALLLVAGCVSTSPPTTEERPDTLIGKHALYPSLGIQYMSCDYRRWTTGRRSAEPVPQGLDREDHHRSASALHTHSPAKKSLAADAFVYAMLANNIYGDDNDKPAFITPGWTVLERTTAESGFKADLVEGRIDDRRVLAVVFEGTHGWRDWQANLSLWPEPVQYGQAQQYVAKLLEKMAYKDAKIVLVGHSLGGGIAINVAMRQATVHRPLDVYAFNSSPRGFYGVGPRPPEGAHFHFIDESGEFLKLGRLLWAFKSRHLPEPDTYQFLKYRWTKSLKPAAEHSIYRMSRALLLLAIGTGDAQAKSVFRANFPPPHVWNPAWPASDSERAVDNAFCEDIIARDLPRPRPGS